MDKIHQPLFDQPMPVRNPDRPMVNKESPALSRRWLGMTYIHGAPPSRSIGSIGRSEWSPEKGWWLVSWNTTVAWELCMDDSILLLLFCLAFQKDLVAQGTQTYPHVEVGEKNWRRYSRSCCLNMYMYNTYMLDCTSDYIKQSMRVRDELSRRPSWRNLLHSMRVEGKRE